MNKAVSVQTGGQAGGQAQGVHFIRSGLFSPPFFCFGRRTRTKKQPCSSQSSVCTDKRERDSFCKEKKRYLSFKCIYIYILWYICSLSLFLSHIHLPPSTIHPSPIPPPPLFLPLTKQSSQPNSPDTSSQETSSPHPTTKYSFHTPWEKTNTRPE